MFLKTLCWHERREKWTQQIAQAKLIERPELAREIAKPDALNALAPMNSAAVTMQQRGVKYTERLATVAEKVLPHLESLEPAAILEGARNLEQFDRVARRNFGLEDQPPGIGTVNLAFLTNQAAVQVVSNPV